MTILDRLRGGSVASMTGAEWTPAEVVCAGCGVAAEDGVVREARDVTPIGPTGKRGPETTLDLGLCSECAVRAARVEAIVRAHPRLVANLPGVGSRAVSNALDALAAIGQPLPAADVADRELAALVHHLAMPGGRLAWRYRVRREDAGSAPPWPFAYLPEDDLAAVRQAYGGYLHERAMRGRPPVRLAPPSTSDRPGCLFCGIGTQPVAAERAAREGRDAVQAALWWPVTTTDRAVGGHGPDRLRGHVCVPCAEALGSVGAVGRTALALALVAHLRASGAEQVARAIEVAERDVIGVQGLVGWGALPPGTPPNRAPWSHVDLSAIE